MSRVSCVFPLSTFEGDVVEGIVLLSLGESG